MAPVQRMRVDVLDLEFQGTPRVIASFLVHGPRGPVLIETGPESTLPALLDGLREHGVSPRDIRDVLVTHIHLDHAGACGWWAQNGARIFVHPVGAPHVVDPSKLVNSAARIYGDRMDELWGTIRPAPAERVIAVADGEVIEAGGLRIAAVETPGHAYHHHVYRIDDVAFAGDAAGIKLPGNRWTDLPAPPPEFDLERWKKTLERLRGLGLRTLYRTHFGGTSDVAQELDGFEKVLVQAVEWIAEMSDAGLEREAMIVGFSARMRSWAESIGTRGEDVRAYELANPRFMSVDGIVRYRAKLRR